MAATDDLWEVRVIFAGHILRLLGWMEGTDKLVPRMASPKRPEDPDAGNPNNRNPKEHL
jgi:hypothetical protein